MKTIEQMTAEIREVVVAKGFRPAEGGPGTNTWGDYVALLHSEISEALEAYRDRRLEDATRLPTCRNVRCERLNRSNPRPGDADFGLGAPPCPAEHLDLPKPEGVGSELADVWIRLLDMADVFEIPLHWPHLTIAKTSSLRGFFTPDGLTSFGDHMTWLHRLVAELGDARTDWRATKVAVLTGAITAVAAKYGVDLEAEYERKLAYNRTRSWRHGRGALGSDR